MPHNTPYDPLTFEFYARNADEYAARRTRPSATLEQFLARLPQGARILELGSGAGLEAQYMLERGFDITATEGSPELGKFAIERLGQRAKIMRFDQLAEKALYDGIWANMCLLHVPWDELDSIIDKIHCALKPGGVLMASFKSGEGAARDRHDRYYNLPTKPMLEEKFTHAAPWQKLDLIDGQGGTGYDGASYKTLFVTAVA